MARRKRTTGQGEIEDTEGVIRRHKSLKDREHNGQKFEDTKGVIRRHKSMKDREHNGQQFEDTKGVIRRHKSTSNFGHCVLCPSLICVF
jgi:hypothetical protein